MSTTDGVGRNIKQAQTGAGFHQVTTLNHQLGQLLEALAFFLEPRRPFQHQRVGRLFYLLTGLGRQAGGVDLETVRDPSVTQPVSFE